MLSILDTLHQFSIHIHFVSDTFSSFGHDVRNLSSQGITPDSVQRPEQNNVLVQS